MFSGTVLFCTFVRVWHEVRSRRRLRPHFDLGIAAAMVAGLFLYGLSAMMRQPEKTIDLRARVMQMNIDLEDKWSEDLAVRQKVIYDYRDLTRTFVEAAPHDLVLWPETALPGVFNFPWVQEYLNDHILKGDEFYLIAGLEDSNLQNTEIYNTITIMKGDTGSHQMHRKNHLMPFGEYIPFRKTFPLFAWIAGGVIVQDFTAGESLEPLSIEKEGRSIGIIPLICIDDTIPFHARAFIRPGPQILVNVTNDGWFFDSVQPQQHFDNAIFRCIELRRPMIRAANTGVSGFIDERGSVYDRTGREKNERILRDGESGSTYIRGSLPATLAVDLDPPITVFARIGDSFSIAMGLIALGFALVPWARKRVKSAT
jgi:apolipoprotein N-acyltransferase